MTEANHPGRATTSFLQTEAHRLATLCIACGNCLRACPMTPYAASAAQADPATVMQGIRVLLQGQTAPAESLEFVSVCTRSALCSTVCPIEGLDPAFMMRLAKMSALGAFSTKPQIPVHEDTQFAPRIKAFARLTLSETEQEEWL